MIPTLWAGSDGAPVLLVAGPPLAASAFRELQARLLPRRTGALELIEAPGVDTFDALTLALAEAVKVSGARALIAYGLAVPLALRAGAPRLLVADGPVASLDPFSASLARLPPSALSSLALRGGLMRRWLPSSVGLRRLVLNPYVMDHDTVVSLSDPFFGSGSARRRTACWLQGLPGAVERPVFEGGSLSGIWGEDDRIYSASKAKEEILSLGGGWEGEIAGGRHLHLIERPWSFADRVAEWLNKG